MTYRIGACGVLLVLLGLTGCYFGPRDYEKLPNPPFSKDKGIAVLFVGLAFKGQDMTSGMDMVSQELHRRGIPAVSAVPGDWAEIARELAALPEIRRAPIAVVGYSVGGSAVTRLADALRAAGVPVQTLVVIEGWDTGLVPCNVGKAIDVYNAGLLSLGRSLGRGPGFTGELRQIDISQLPGAAAGLNHWSISWSQDVRRLLEEELVDGDRIRRRPVPPGEAACLAGAPPAG